MTKRELNAKIVKVSVKEMYVCVLSHFSRVWLFVTPWTVARQASQSVGLSWQEYWSGLPFPSPQYCYYRCSTKHPSFWDTLLINSSQILWKHRKTLCSLNSSELLAQDWGFNGIMFIFLCLFMFVFLNA